MVEGCHNLTRRLALGLAAVTLCAYGQVAFNDFVNLDDGIYVTDNPYVLGGLTSENLVWAWTTLTGSLYQPLTWVSLQLDAQLFGSGAAGFHITNLLFHLANVLLLFFLLNWLTKMPWRSSLVAALFAVHPMHVESVAWVTERKDVLMAFFWLLMIAAYGWYAQKPSVAKYLLVLAAFGAGLLSKAMIVTGPFLLFLLDFWPLRRIGQGDDTTGQPHDHPRCPPRRLRWLVVEKLPMLAVALMVTWQTVHNLELQHPRVIALDVFPPAQRLSTALVSYCWYLWTTFVPLGLAPLHPYPVLDTSLTLRAGAILLAGTLALIWYGRREPALAVGWLWFLGTLVPVVAMVPGGIVPWADRYVYFSHIGLFLVVVWGAGTIFAQRRIPVAVARLLGVAMVTVLAAATWFQVGHWRNSETLFTHTLRVTGESPVAHVALGGYYQKRNEPDKAMVHFSRAAALAPNQTLPLLHYGEALLHSAQYDEAIRVLKESVALDPTCAACHLYLAYAFSSINKLADARRHVEQYLLLPGANAVVARNRASLSQAYDLLGVICLRSGDLDRAADSLTHSLRNQPTAKSFALMGTALGRLGRWAEAEKHFVQAKSLGPNDSYHQSYRAYTLAQMGQKEAAAHEYADLLRRVPDWPATTRKLALQLLTKERARDERTALELATQACAATAFKDAYSLDLLAAAQAANGNFGEAQQTAAAALALARDPDLERDLQERLQRYTRNQALPVEK